jgi:hypothetical protein
MTKPAAILLFCNALLFAVHSIHVDSADAYDAGCSRHCITQSIDCLEKVKDSVNDIDRELCENERRECLSKCDEDFKKDVEQAERERVLKEQEQKALWESQGLTLKQQNEEKLKAIEIEVEKRREEREERKEREE